MSDRNDTPGHRAGLPYLAAVDGMRGIGVTTVLLYHAGVSWLAGAFLDIDLFFVTSGLLITTVLLTERHRTGRIRLRQFWLNRARRLLPALLGCLLLVAAYAKWFAPKDMVWSIRQDILWTLGFASNWHFIRDGQSYFATEATVSPLLHTWSLAIEEQFYLAWPILLVLWLRWRRGNTKWLAPVLLVLAVASAIYMASLYVPWQDPSNVYYNTFSRAQALLMGCALGVILFRKGLGRRREGITPPPRSRNVLRLGGLDLTMPSPAGWAGLAAFAVMLALPIVVDESSTWVFRGGFLLAGAAAMALGFALTADPRSAVARLLSWGPLAAIGRRTYGLYVWHWPLFLILSEERTGLSGLALLVVRMAVVFAWAFAFDRWVERPIRRGALRRMPSPRGALAAVASVLIVGGTGLAATANAEPTVFGTALPGYISTVTGPLKPGQTRVVVLGDSVGFTLWRHFPQKDFGDVSVGSSTQLGCGIALPQSLQIDDYVAATATQCEGFERRWTTLLDAVQPQVVVLNSGTAELFDHNVEGRALRSGDPEYATFMRTAYAHAIEVAGANGRYPVLVGNIPCYGRKDDVTPEQARGMGLPDGDLDAAERVQNDPARQDRLNAILAEVVAAAPKASILDNKSFLCPNGSFEEVVDGVTMRPDGVHLVAPGVTKWWERFMPQVLAAAESTPAPQIAGR